MERPPFRPEVTRPWEAKKPKTTEFRPRVKKVWGEGESTLKIPEGLTFPEERMRDRPIKGAFLEAESKEKTKLSGHTESFSEFSPEDIKTAQGIFEREIKPDLNNTSPDGQMILSNIMERLKTLPESVLRVLILLIALFVGPSLMQGGQTEGGSEEKPGITQMLGAAVGPQVAEASVIDKLKVKYDDWDKKREKQEMIDYFINYYELFNRLEEDLGEHGLQNIVFVDGRQETLYADCAMPTDTYRDKRRMRDECEALRNEIVDDYEEGYKKGDPNSYLNTRLAQRIYQTWGRVPKADIEDIVNDANDKYEEYLKNQKKSANESLNLRADVVINWDIPEECESYEKKFSKYKMDPIRIIQPEGSKYKRIEFRTYSNKNVLGSKDEKRRYVVMFVELKTGEILEVIKKMGQDIGGEDRGMGPRDVIVLLTNEKTGRKRDLISKEKDPENYEKSRNLFVSQFKKVEEQQKEGEMANFFE